MAKQMQRWEQEAARVAADIIRNRRMDIEDRADVRFYMGETEMPEYMEETVWNIIIAELGL